MKEKRILQALELVDEQYIEEASPAKQKPGKPLWVRWVVAAAICACIATGIVLFPGKTPNQTSVGGVLREYKEAAVLGEVVAIEWPWEYKTLPERFPTILFEGQEYGIKAFGQTIDATFIGEKLGKGEGTGYDMYADQYLAQDFDIWLIKGVSEKYMVAAEMEGEFYSYRLNEYIPPVTFADVLDDYSLSQTLSLHYFIEYKDDRQVGYYSLKEDGYIWQLLSACRAAPFVEDTAWRKEGKDRIVFTATSEPLGVYKCSFYVSADGYIGTNVFDYLYTFEIGEKAAQDIIAYARKNAKEAAYESYWYSLAGTLTEIGDGYIIVDDTILCKNEKDGMRFKVLTSDVRMRRYIEFQKIKTGSIVVIQFTNPVNVKDGNTISSAISMTYGFIEEGKALSLE